MTEEVQVPAGAEPVPEQVATAAPGAEDTSPETPEQSQDKPAAKSFTQEEVDALIGKRLAREQRKWEREQATRQVPPAAPPAAPAPQQDQFESPEAYAEALATRKAEELIARRDEEQRQATLKSAYHEREEAALDKYDDFEQVAYNPKLPITDVMAEAIQASDIGPDVAYWLGSNPKEAGRIARLTPTLQAKEIGKIEATLAAAPLVKKTTTAPAPITPVTARASGSPSYDTTDPRSTKALSVSDWIAAERARQMKKAQAQRT